MSIFAISLLWDSLGAGGLCDRDQSRRLQWRARVSPFSWRTTFGTSTNRQMNHLLRLSQSRQQSGYNRLACCKHERWLRRLRQQRINSPKAWFPTQPLNSWYRHGHQASISLPLMEATFPVERDSLIHPSILEHIHLAHGLPLPAPCILIQFNPLACGSLGVKPFDGFTVIF